MFCAELMSSMKDVPSTQRMVMCSQRWKLLKQCEKDAYQKRCEQVPSTGITILFFLSFLMENIPFCVKYLHVFLF